MKQQISQKTIIKITAFVLAALISIFVIRPWAGSFENYNGTMRRIDKQKTIVNELFIGSTAASIAITAAPDDIGTPIAENLANMSNVFLFLLTFLLLEKYLLCIVAKQFEVNWCNYVK